MPKDVLPFSQGNCPKCKGASTALKLEYKDSCPENAVCQGVQGEHLHLTCQTCSYIGVMQTADAQPANPSPSPAPATVVAGERPRKLKKKHRV